MPMYIYFIAWRRCFDTIFFVAFDVVVSFVVFFVAFDVGLFFVWVAK